MKTKKRNNTKPIQTVNEAKKLASGLNPADKVRLEGRRARHPGLYKHASRRPDTSDIPEVSKEFFDKAKLRPRPGA